MKTSDKNSAVLFAGVTGNARLQEKLGNAEALRAADRCVKRIERAIEAAGGRVALSDGNECVGIFSAVDEALQAAVDMQQKVADLPPISGIKLTMRVGFSWGQVGGSESEPAGEAVNIAAQLAGLAGPGQILTTDQARTALSPMLQRCARSIGVPTTQGRLAGNTIFEIVIPSSGEDLPSDSSVVVAAHAQNSTPNSFPRLRLSHAGQVFVLDDNQLKLTIGRGPDCDVHIDDRRASRLHALLERRNSRLVLTDTSTNGTFVTLEGEPEIRLRQGECTLHGKGTISFASSKNSEDAETAEFEQLFGE